MSTLTSTGLIGASALQALLERHRCAVLVLDASADLTEPSAGAWSYAAGHLPGALHVDLERDMSAPKTGRNGRHPLPSRQDFAVRMAALGADADMAIVVYDSNGGMYASRLWWMLRWAGHADVALLDGGLAAWKSAGGAIESGQASARPPGRFELRPALESTIAFDAVRAGLGQGGRLIVDARSADRFRGENETLDPIAGRIPGAVNRCFRDNLDAAGRFKPPEQLRAEWLGVLGERSPPELVQQCGSGVTACHNMLAMHVAGLDGSVLYAGSWSEWCAQPDAPMVSGPQA